ncbi:MAG: hypothetical protein N0C81_14300 [Candidatus Thiodiazotropha lotti]|uniref:Uncharacterized protein n=1 Tax=Candidatus Thiodiazotropha lotti TaxID=2792787 RepID=A0A9E4K5I1_9GAMM|nr:hypothetical protein [Candidatus Thiodiazotropha lotti]MCG7939463.1 hypothetical protein [Candidatus Thiodiazotropha lotti]MCG8002255.1 hypothetical protein [Candidatus Thiodiazotropha lotti]MCG8008801.1 hypothetical protein [Candidatus Thiodiazotropha lotti]MCW4185874.1 hypothetical protein [Candidatus Thiodiazotropha lotti]
MIKRIIIISALHFVVFTIALVVGVTIEADVIRNGEENLPISGNIFKVMVKILSQPAQSVILNFISKDSYLFWPIVIVNSMIWGVLISTLLGKKKKGKTGSD